MLDFLDNPALLKASLEQIGLFDQVSALYEESVIRHVEENGETMIDPLFQPITINRMEVKNRIFMPAMHHEHGRKLCGQRPAG